MTKLVEVLPDFADELAQGLAALGFEQLAATVRSIEIVERCRCDQPGCVTFYTMPKDAVLKASLCERIIAPAAGVTCVHYAHGQIIWIEALGRPADLERLDRVDSNDART